ncbi:MAG: hypothetical protein AB7S44_00965 [Spirochaetales bacterium]
MERYRNLTEQKFYEFALLSLVAKPRLAQNNCVAWMPINLEGTLSYTDFLITNERSFQSAKNIVGLERHPALVYFERQILNVNKLMKLTGCKQEAVENMIDKYKAEVEEGMYKNNLKVDFKVAFNAFMSNIVSMYTSQAEKDLFNSLTQNLTDLNYLGVMEKAGNINKLVQETFPEHSDWKVAPAADVVLGNHSDLHFPKNSDLNKGDQEDEIKKL